MSRVVLESPLSGDFVRNFRYLLWCCRAVWFEDSRHAIASHLICPWFMDDRIEAERQAGIENAWVWDPRVPHWFFVDFGMSHGMQLARERCEESVIPWKERKLETYSPESWAAFGRGEWPPHTPGFELGAVAKLEELARTATSRLDFRQVEEIVPIQPPTLRAGCQHPKVSPAFDYEASKGLSSREVRQRWPRFYGQCPDCGFNGVIYASLEHFVSGDW